MTIARSKDLLGPRCRSCPSRRDSGPGAAVSCCTIAFGGGGAHLDYIRTQHQARLATLGHGRALWTDSAAAGDARGCRGCVVVVLQTHWERQLAGKGGTRRHAGRRQLGCMDGACWLGLWWPSLLNSRRGPWNPGNADQCIQRRVWMSLRRRALVLDPHG